MGSEKKQSDGFLDIPDFNNTRLLIYGDVMLDRYWYGDTSRISPEAPVPVLRVQDSELRPGGAANVAVNVASLGARVDVLGYVGNDQEGKDLEALLVRRGVACLFEKINNQPTITKLRVIGRNQQLLRMDFEEGFHERDHQAQIARYQQQLHQAQVVILSDYAKGTLHNIGALIDMAVDAGKPVLVDPKHADFMRYQRATLLTPNRKEFEAMVGVCQDKGEIIDKARDVIERAQLKALLVTLGKDGMLLIDKHNTALHLPTHARDVYDVTGAGDTVIAVLAASIAAGHSLSEAARLANIAAGIVVRKLGAETVSTAELRASLQKSHHQLRVLSEGQLLDVVTVARCRGEKIVMTNGCFDILHAGHVQYLEQAKALGDRLIVAVNSDESVRLLKGDERPLNPLSERMQVLAGLGAVDWVVPFTEETPARLIAKVLPDVLVKGGDYNVSEIAGHQDVIDNGGQVEVLQFKEGCSTTRLIEKIKKLEEEVL